MTALASYFPLGYFYDVFESSGGVPTAPMLSIADNGDGSGATATISGSAVGSVNTVYVQSVASIWQPPLWQTSGSRSGDGTIALALPVGHYLAYVISVLGGNSVCGQPVYFTVTAGAVSIKSQILAAVQAKLQALGLAGIANDSIVIKKLPISRYLEDSSAERIAMPAAIIADIASESEPPRGTCQLDDVDYPVQITLVLADNQEPTLEANHNQQLLWRQQIAQAFRFQRLPGVPNVINCVVEPSTPIDQAAWLKNYYASALTLRFTSREPRT